MKDFAGFIFANRVSKIFLRDLFLRILLTKFGKLSSAKTNPVRFDPALINPHKVYFCYNGIPKTVKRSHIRAQFRNLFMITLKLAVFPDFI